MSDHDREAALIDQMRAFLGQELEVDPCTIPLDADIMTLGVTSTSLVGLIGDLEDALDIELSPAVLHKHSTITRLAGYLAKLD